MYNREGRGGGGGRREKGEEVERWEGGGKGERCAEYLTLGWDKIYPLWIY